MPWLRINIPVGTVAALMTTLEYLIGTLAALCARALLHGLWLMSLHREQQVSLHANTRQRRSLCKDLLGLVLGIWLVIGVALVESSLQTGFVIQDTVINSPNCVSMYGRYLPDRLVFNKPPYSSGVQPWIYKVARALRCGTRGIATVGVGGLTDQMGMLQNTSAPVCAQLPVDVHAQSIHAQIDLVTISPNAIFINLKLSDAFVIFPLDGANLGRDLSEMNAQSESRGVCGRKGISSYTTRIPTTYQTAHVQSENMTRAVWHSICARHQSPISLVSSQTIRMCMRGIGDTISIKCIVNNIPSSQIFHTHLPQTSVLLVGHDQSKPSYACPRASLRVEYVFLPSETILTANSLAFARLPVLLPTLVRAVDGHCERTIAPLAQAALLYSADAIWTRDSLAKLSDRERYYAYMMSVSASMFPLNDVKGVESASDNGSCQVRPIRAVTEIQNDWRLVVLLSGLATALAIIVAGAALRAWFLQAWSVGSAQWSLDRMVERCRGGKSDFEEVVSVRNVDTARGGVVGAWKRRNDTDDVEAVQGEWDDGFDASTLGSRSFVNVVGSQSIYALDVRSVDRFDEPRPKGRERKNRPRTSQDSSTTD